MSPQTRRERERQILQILAERPIHTQEDLVRELHVRGFVVTQATVSRDLRRLEIVKLHPPEGAPRYVRREEAGLPSGGGERDARAEVAAAFQESVLEIDSGDALLAVRTPPGLANAVAIALDRARIPEIVATVAGDDTIFLLMRNAADRREVRRLLEGFL